MKRKRMAPAPQPQVHDVGARYNSRVMVLEVYINTDQDAETVMRRVRNVVRGPRLDATAITVKVYEGAAGKEAWNVISTLMAQGFADPGAKPFK